jgi:hypothetical protein
MAGSGWRSTLQDRQSGEIEFAPRPRPFALIEHQSNGLGSERLIDLSPVAGCHSPPSWTSYVCRNVSAKRVNLRLTGEIEVPELLHDRLAAEAQGGLKALLRGR